MFKVNPASSRELQAAIFAFRAASKSLRKDLHAAVRQEVGGMWLPELQARATRRQDQQVIVRGARVASRTDGFTLMAAKSRRPLSGYFFPYLTWYAVELGARVRREQVTRQTKHGSVTYTTTLNRGLPKRTYGRIAYPAASKIGRRAVAVWVRTIVDTYRKAAGDTR